MSDMVDKFYDDYKKSTGRTSTEDFCIECGSYDKDFYEYIFNRIELAEARFRAGEKLIIEPEVLPHEYFDMEEYNKDYLSWQQSIKNYGDVVKEG